MAIDEFSPPSVYDGGGLIGKRLYFSDTSLYFPLSYVGGYTEGYSGTTSDITVSLTSLSDGIASSPSQDDIVIVCFALNPDDTNAVSYRISGYTEIANITSVDTEQAQLQVGYKIMGASPDTSVTITGGTGDIDQAGAVAVHVWRGIDTVNPFDTTATTVTQTNTVLADPPSISPVTANSVVLAVGAGGHSRGTDTFSSSLDLSNFISSGANDTHDVTIGLGSVEWSGSGAVDPAAFTFSNSDSTSFAAAAVTMALKPNEGNRKNSGIWSLKSTATPKLTVTYLVIAGGASGGNRNGGGGGAGGYKEGTLSLVPNTDYTVTIGAGGSQETVLDADGNDGSNSRFSTLTLTGGGGGGADNGDFAGRDGGSGGGGRGFRSGAGGSGISGQGNNGGSGATNTGVYGSGGGGGASAVGVNGSGTKGGNGGSGTSSSITGTSVTRAGGGGGGSEGSTSSTRGTGTGGGGDGGWASGSASAGDANTGGGGGGGGIGTTARQIGAAGGSGVVALQYPSYYTITLAAGLSGTTSYVGSNKVTVITAGTGNVSFS